MSLDKEKVSNAVSALIKVAEKLKQKSLIDDVEVVQLQICVAKIPPKEKSIKLKLPTGLRNEKTEVCLFVKDLDGGKDRDYEPTKSHTQEILDKHNIEGISEVIPLKSLKLEYKPYEAKRNLSNAYDVFLADARIIRLLPSLLGKHFYGRKKLPVQVNLEAKNLKEECESAINSSRCNISNKGSVSAAVIANLEMTETEVVDNVMSSVNQICNAVPGGWSNVKQLSLKTMKSPSIPIYMCEAAPQDITIAKEDQRETVEAEEISTLFGAKVKVYPSGTVKILRDGKEDESSPKKRRRVKNKKKKVKKSKTKDSEDSSKETQSKESKKKTQKVKNVSKPEPAAKKAAKIDTKTAVKTPIRGSKRKLTS